MADVTVQDPSGDKRCRVLDGVVVSNSMDKTIVVRVVRTYRHPTLNKTVRSAKRYHVHDEDKKARVGDIVKIQESRPLSKEKRMTLAAVVKAASVGA